jgi:hypothetical protein
VGLLDQLDDLGLLGAWLHPFHRVRACDGSCLPVSSPDQRPTVGAAARAWYTQAKAAYDRVHGEGPVPMLVAGGGIRAAYWTATVLEQLEMELKGQGGVRPYLFAISGVSGGSVGAAAFEAALIRRDEKHCMVGDEACPLATCVNNVSAQIDDGNGLVGRQHDVARIGRLNSIPP